MVWIGHLPLAQLAAGPSRDTRGRRMLRTHHLQVLATCLVYFSQTSSYMQRMGLLVQPQEGLEPGLVLGGESKKVGYSHFGLGGCALHQNSSIATRR